jgi:hypothetical protein
LYARSKLSVNHSRFRILGKTSFHWGTPINSIPLRSKVTGPCDGSMSSIYIFVSSDELPYIYIYISFFSFYKVFIFIYKSKQELSDTREKILRMLVVCMQMSRIRHLAIVNICKCNFHTSTMVFTKCQNLESVLET